MYKHNNNLKKEAMDVRHSKVGIYREIGGKKEKKLKMIQLYYTLKKFKVLKNYYIVKHKLISKT